jgi:hypothetical protein
MKRLLQASKTEYDVGEKVRFADNSKQGFYTVIQKNEDKYTVGNESGDLVKDVTFENLAGDDEFIVGDKVIFDKHPYDNTDVYEVKEALADGTYFIENNDAGYTGINGKNLTLVEK